MTAARPPHSNTPASLPRPEARLRGWGRGGDLQNQEGAPSVSTSPFPKQETFTHHHFSPSSGRKSVAAESYVPLRGHDPEAPP